MNFAATKTIICAGDYTQLNDLSSVDVKEWQWQIQGGSPAISTEKILGYYSKSRARIQLSLL
ncbi:MAG: hypothetical protein U0T81_01955 [Saprospiraceae bacterium]